MEKFGIRSIAVFFKQVSLQVVLSILCAAPFRAEPAELPLWEETRQAGLLRPGRRAATRTPHAVLAGSYAPAPRAQSAR